MDSSINKTEQIVDTNTFVNTNLNLFSNILNSLETVSSEAKSFLKEKLSTDGKINNELLENISTKVMGMLGLKLTELH